jgi:hypothetical protein
MPSSTFESSIEAPTGIAGKVPVLQEPNAASAAAILYRVGDFLEVR